MSSRNAAFHQVGVARALFAPLRWVFYTALLLLALMLAAWIVDEIFVFRVWPEGVAHLKDLLAYELKELSVLGGWHHALASFALGVGDALYAVIFRWSGVHDMGVRFASETGMAIPDTIVRRTYSAHYAEIQVAMLATQLLGIRLALLMATLPDIVLVYAVAMSDGLAWRSIRRLRGGHESSTIYHRTKYFQLTGGSMTAALYLLLPMPSDIRVVFACALQALGIFAYWQWVFYKKYL